MDVPTTSAQPTTWLPLYLLNRVSGSDLIINSINQLTDALTGLERILTTPIPFSFVHQPRRFYISPTLSPL